MASFSLSLACMLPYQVLITRAWWLSLLGMEYFGEFDDSERLVGSDKRRSVRCDGK